MILKLLDFSEEQNFAILIMCSAPSFSGDGRQDCINARQLLRNLSRKDRFCIEQVCQDGKGGDPV